MCNTSRFQQERKFKRLSEITGLNFVKSYQENPRKFEVIMETRDFWKNQIRFYVFFGDTEVTFREIGQREWYLLN